MNALYDLIVTLGPWSWFIAGVLLMALETLVPGVHFLWFGLSAIVVGIIAFAFPALSIPWQLVLFAIVSVATVFFVRRFANAQDVESAERDLNQRGHQYLGRLVTVEEEIRGGRGRVRVGDTLWPASGADAEKGSQVRITGVNGTVFVVEPA
jgi:membrane protein implicated in regulation of membrane protease activity